MRGAVPATAAGRRRIDRAGNVIASLRPTATAPYVALTAHLDTVLAPRNKDEIAVEPDGRLRGPGVADNGAGLAALLAVARALKACPPQYERRPGLLLVANVGEEGEGNLSGMRLSLPAGSPLAPPTGGLPGAGRRQYRPHHRRGRWAAAVSKSPSPDRAGIAGAISARATRCTRSAARSRCSPTRGWTAPPSIPERGHDRGRHQASTPFPTHARAKVDIRSESNGNAWTSWWNCSTRPWSARRRSRTSARFPARWRARIKEIGSRPGGIAGRRCTHPRLLAGGGCAPGHPLASGLLVDRRQHPAVTWAFPPSRSAPEATAGARTRRRSGSARRAATWD